MAQTVEQAWLDISSAAEYTGAGVSTLRYAAQSGELYGEQRVKRGRWRFRRDDLDRWVRGEKPRQGRTA